MLYDKQTDTIAVIDPNKHRVNIARKTLGVDLVDGELKGEPKLKPGWRLAEPPVPAATVVATPAPTSPPAPEA